MGKTFSVESFEAMSNAAKELNEHAETYRSISTQLINIASTISSWGGADQLAFAQKVQGLTGRMQAVSAKLLEASKILQMEKDNYVGTQNALVEGAGKLQN